MEEADGWRQMWAGRRRRNEAAAQYLFLGVVMQYCAAKQVRADVDQNMGRKSVLYTAASGEQAMEYGRRSSSPCQPIRTAWPALKPTPRADRSTTSRRERGVTAAISSRGAVTMSATAYPQVSGSRYQGS